MIGEKRDFNLSLLALRSNLDILENWVATGRCPRNDEQQCKGICELPLTRFNRKLISTYKALNDCGELVLQAATNACLL